MSYRELRVWQGAQEQAAAFRQISLRELPKFELYETLHAKTQTLGRKLNRFIASVDKQHHLPRSSDQ